MPQISVIMPVYNVASYLPRCMESIINQTWKDFELICIDDGSTDSSSRILDDYAKKDSRIKVIHKENTGYGSTMNTGLKYAVGEYIAIIESDDFAEPEMLDKLYQAALVSGADIVKGNHFNHVEGQDSFCDWLSGFPKNQLINSRVFPHLLGKADTIWTCLYRRRFLLENQIWFHETPGASFQDISFAEQGWLWAETVYLIEDPLLHYRKDNLDSSMHNPEKVFCVFEEYEWLEEKFSGYWKSHPKIENYFAAAKYEDYFRHYQRVAPPYQYALLTRLADSLKRDVQKGRVNEEAFSPQVWNDIRTILQNKNRFFQATAKDRRDLRLSQCGFHNADMYEKAWLHTLASFPQVVIYGAGQVGKKLAETLAKNGIRIDRFVVTHKEQGQDEYNGIPIAELQETAGLADTCAIIIAVTEGSQYELYKNLMEYRFQTIFRVDEVMRRLMQKAE